MPHGFRNQLAGSSGSTQEQVRVIAPHVGGGFGGKAGMLAEHTVAIGAARRLGRPVSWVETRTENLVAMPHGRGQVGYYELGPDRDGRCPACAPGWSATPAPTPGSAARWPGRPT